MQKKSLIVRALVFTLLLLLLGFGACLPLMLDMGGGDMAACPFMQGMQALCPMNVGDHIAAWKQAGLATIPTGKSFALLILFILVLTHRRTHSHAGPLHARLLRALDRVRLAFLHTREPMRHAYARGILSSRLFDGRQA